MKIIAGICAHDHRVDMHHESLKSPKRNGILLPIGKENPMKASLLSSNICPHLQQPPSEHTKLSETRS